MRTASVLILASLVGIAAPRAAHAGGIKSSHGGFASFAHRASLYLHNGSIPAWARRYNVNCSHCHTPAVPRLNADGMRFKWAGYRMAEDIESKDKVDVGKVQNYLAVGARMQYDWEKTRGAPTSTSGFSLPSVGVFYAGPFGRNLSGFLELEHGPENEIERVAHVSVLWGTQRRYGGFRFGQMHYLAEWGVAGFDRPIGISAPLAIAGPITNGVPFTLGEHQLGAEAFYVAGANRLSAMVLNGVNALGMGAVSDADTRKDLVLTDQVLIDNAGSGIQAAAYYGTIVGLDTASALLNTHFWRLGITANKIFNRFEVLGALIYGKDTSLPFGGTSPFPTATDKGLGYWLSGQYTLANGTEPGLTLFGRYEHVNPNTAEANLANRRLVAGAVLPISLPQYLRWALEYRRDFPQGGRPKTNAISTQLWLNF